MYVRIYIWSIMLSRDAPSTISSFGTCIMHIFAALFVPLSLMISICGPCTCINNKLELIWYLSKLKVTQRSRNLMRTLLFLAYFILVHIYILLDRSCHLSLCIIEFKKGFAGCCVWSDEISGRRHTIFLNFKWLNCWRQLNLAVSHKDFTRISRYITTYRWVFLSNWTRKGKSHFNYCQLILTCTSQMLKMRTGSDGDQKRIISLFTLGIGS